MINQAQYFKGAHIIVKFQQGLNPCIQDSVTCLTTGRPSDDNLKAWYAGAILCDKNHIANEAFKASLCLAPCFKILPLNGGLFHKPMIWQMSSPLPPSQTMIPPSHFAPPIATPLNPSLHSTSAAQNTTDATMTVCYWCGQPGHSQKECPKWFNIHYMDIEEWQSFAQDKFTTLDVAEAEVTLDFGRDSEC